MTFYYKMVGIDSWKEDKTGTITLPENSYIVGAVPSGKDTVMVIYYIGAPA